MSKTRHGAVKQNAGETSKTGPPCGLESLPEKGTSDSTLSLGKMHVVQQPDPVLQGLLNTHSFRLSESETLHDEAGMGF